MTKQQNLLTRFLGRREVEFLRTGGLADKIARCAIARGQQLYFV